MSYPGLPQTQPNYSPNAVPYLEEGDDLDEVLRTLDDFEQKRETDAAKNMLRDTFLSTLEKMREELTDIKASIKELHEKIHPAPRMSYMGYEFKPTPQTHPCFICGEMGHWSPRCPKNNRSEATVTRPTVTTPTLKTEPDTRQSDQCYKCHQTGHWAYQCPEQTQTGTKRKLNTMPKKGGKTSKKVKGEPEQK